MLQTDFMDSSQLLSQVSLTAGKDAGVECVGCNFQNFLSKANEGINTIISDTDMSDDSSLKTYNTDSMEISASLFLSILGINPDFAKNNQVIDLKLIENKGLENINAVDFLKSLGFNEDDARGMAAQVVNVSQKFEGINKTDGVAQFLSQPDYRDSLRKNIMAEVFQKDVSADSVQIQESLEDIKNDVSDKLELKPKFTSNKQDMLDRLFNKESIEENLKILNSVADNNSIKAEGEDTDGDIKVSNDFKLIDKQGTPSSDSEETIDSDSFNLEKSFPEIKELPVKYTSVNTGLKGFDSIPAEGIENTSQSSKASLSNSVINQIVENAQIIVKGDKKEIKIHLDPPSLGSIHMKVTMDSHSMKATMIADTPHVKEVIESNLNELKRSLADSGIKVEQFSVFVGHGYNQNDAGNAQIYRADVGMSDVISMADISDKRMDIRGIINSQNLINIFV
jgi:hypothetical protein